MLYIHDIKYYFDKIENNIFIGPIYKTSFRLTNDDIMKELKIRNFIKTKDKF